MLERLFLCLTLTLLLPGAALAQTFVDTFGGTASNSSTSGPRLKANLYTPAGDCTLDSAEIWFGGTGTYTVGLWEQNSPGSSSYTSVWTGTISPGTTTKGWRSVTVGEPLTGGLEYILGVHISGTTGYYSFSNSSSYAGSAWGAQTDWDDDAASSSFPSTLSGVGSNNSAGGYYQRLTISVNSDSDGDGWTTGDGDCDDTNPAVFPGAGEICDGLDGNCDGLLPVNEQDNDVDGEIPCLGDCDDFDNTIYSTAPELCDGLDNDCDLAVDEELSPDVDSDGYSDLGSCLGTADDCDDNEPAVNPGAAELCDGLDNDCDVDVDEGLSEDLDGDGVTAPGSCLGSADDCDDTDSFIYPGATELCDGADNDCNGSLLSDEGDDDGDGYLGCDDDCDDGDGDVNPGVSEDCGNNIDDNCNGSVDEDIDADGDGYGTCEDCNDNLAAVNPGADEAECDGVDTDCDGELHPMELDDDEDGQTGCDGDCDDGNPDTYDGAVEICDNEDNDCDGEVPEDEADCGDDDDDDGGGGGGGSRRGGCDVSGAGSLPSGWLALAGLAWVAVRRRQR